MLTQLTLFRLETGRKGKIVNIVRPLGRYNIYKLQLLVDDTVVSAVPVPCERQARLPRSVYDGSIV